MKHDDITLEMNVAGGLEVKKFLDDPDHMAMENRFGELAARVYRAMRSADSRKFAIPNLHRQEQ